MLAGVRLASLRITSSVAAMPKTFIYPHKEKKAPRYAGLFKLRKEENRKKNYTMYEPFAREISAMFSEVFCSL